MIRARGKCLHFLCWKEGQLPKRFDAGKGGATHGRRCPGSGNLRLGLLRHAGWSSAALQLGGEDEEGLCWEVMRGGGDKALKIP
jgi:hypothetical protein